MAPPASNRAPANKRTHDAGGGGAPSDGRGAEAADTTKRRRSVNNGADPAPSPAADADDGAGGSGTPGDSVPAPLVSGTPPTQAQTQNEAQAHAPGGGGRVGGAGAAAAGAAPLPQAAAQIPPAANAYSNSTWACTPADVAAAKELCGAADDAMRRAQLCGCPLGDRGSDASEVHNCAAAPPGGPTYTISCATSPRARPSSRRRCC
jgi:hypothetical protein